MIKVNHTFTPPTLSDIDALYKQWESVKNSCEYAKFIEDKFKELYFYIKLPDADGLYGIKSVHIMNMLRWLIANASSISLEHVFMFSETSERIDLFMEHASSFDDATYWKELKNCYTIQDYEKISFRVLKSLFMADRSQKELLMNDEESEIFNQLPDSFVIYRGTTIEEKEPNLGLSWTLNKQVAQQFADKKSLRQKTKGIVLSENINKSEAIAYFNERQEEEIIYIKYP